MEVDRQNWNQRVIEEFRAKQGKVDGPLAGAPLLLLHHWGARTGTERVYPVSYQKSVVPGRTCRTSGPPRSQGRAGTFSKKATRPARCWWVGGPWSRSTTG